MKNVFIICEPKDTELIKELGEQLDAGEAEAIVLAIELKAELLLTDEKIGRPFAEAGNIACKGVVGVLIQAKKEGLIASLKPLLDDLIINLKFRLSEHIYRIALQKVGEAK